MVSFQRRLGGQRAPGVPRRFLNSSASSMSLLSSFMRLFSSSWELPSAMSDSLLSSSKFAAHTVAFSMPDCRVFNVVLLAHCTYEITVEGIQVYGTMR